MPPTFLQRRRRPFDPLSLANIFGIGGGTLEDQITRLGGRPAVMPLEGYEDELPVRTRPTVIAPAIPEVPLPTSTAEPPQLSRPLEMPAVPRRPVVIHSGNRPTNVVFGTDDPEQQEMAHAAALRNYQPQKESKKHLALRTLLNFVGTGIPGAVGTLIGDGGVMDRRGLDRAWQESELAKAQANLGGYRDQRRQGLQDELLAAQVDETRAQAQQRLRPARPDIAARKYIERDDGVYEVSLENPEGRRLGNIPAGAAKAGGSIHYVDRPDGVYGVWRDPSGELKSVKVGGVPGRPARVEPPDTASFTNTQLERNIAAAEAEKQTLGAPPPTEIDDVRLDSGKPKVVGKKVNPAYLDWAKRYRELDDQIRRYRADMKAPRPAAIQSRVTEQQIREAAKAKGLDPDTAVQRARSRKLIP